MLKVKAAKRWLYPLETIPLEFANLHVEEMCFLTFLSIVSG